MNKTYTIGMKVRTKKNINALMVSTTMELEGTIVSIDPGLIRIQCRQNAKRSEIYTVRPDQIVEVK